MIYNNKNDRPLTDKQAILGIITLSTILVSTLLIIGKAALTSIAGVTSLFIGGALFPAWIAAFFFISGMASAIDYFSKAYMVMKPHKTEEEQKLIQTKNHEYRYTVAGVCTAIVIASIITLAVIITHGIALLAIPSIYSLCIGGIGGGFSRVGKLKDLSKQKTAEAVPTNTNEDKPFIHVSVSDNSLTSNVENSIQDQISAYSSSSSDNFSDISSDAVLISQTNSTTPLLSILSKDPDSITPRPRKKSVIGVGLKHQRFDESIAVLMKQSMYINPLKTPLLPAHAFRSESDKSLAF